LKDLWSYSATQLLFYQLHETLSNPDTHLLIAHILQKTHLLEVTSKQRTVQRLRAWPMVSVGYWIHGLVNWSICL